MENSKPLVRHALFLEYLTVGWNIVEAGVAIVAGWVAGSIALVGFGLDSIIEVTAAGRGHRALSQRNGIPDLRDVIYLILQGFLLTGRRGEATLSSKRSAALTRSGGLALGCR